MTAYPEAVMQLMRNGINESDAYALRRISMTLHRWHELECGDGNDYAEWTIARGRKVNGAFEYDDNGAPYEERHVHTENKARYTRIPDRERGALKRLGKIMARYPAFGTYVQTDPRGASLYIIPRDKITPDHTIESCYSSIGIAVYR
jgi:hypothetical protein